MQDTETFFYYAALRCELILKICATQELIHWPEAVTDVQSDYIVFVAMAHLPHE